MIAGVIMAFCGLLVVGIIFIVIGIIIELKAGL